MLNDKIQVDESKFSFFLKELDKKVKENNLKEDCINKAFSHPLFNLEDFQRRLDKLLKFALDGLKKLGMDKPASSFLQYVEEECKNSEALRNFIDNPKSGTLILEVYQRLKNTMELMKKYKSGDKKVENELKRRGVI